MKVEIWSDIVCPWCYIGRRRIEKALSLFENRAQVAIIWRSFQLDPSAAHDYAGSAVDLLMQRYGMERKEAEARHQQVAALAAREGLDFRFDRAHPVNSFDAHRLIHLAAKHRLQGEMKERLQKAYFTDGLVISDPETLARLAVEGGLDADETRSMLAGDAYTAAVQTDIRRAQRLGIQGVPFFLFDEKYAVSGAQPVELFQTALERAWAESQQVIES